MRANARTSRVGRGPSSPDTLSYEKERIRSYAPIRTQRVDRGLCSYQAM